MGSTRVLYSDATTAEAANVLKANGFLESNQGGLFTSTRSPVRVYIVWGKSSYYPEILSCLPFTPRIQVHFKCREEHPHLAELSLAAAKGLRENAADAQVRLFDAVKSVEIPC